MNNPIATIKIKEIGTMEFELFMDVPNSTANFISLANEGFYTGLSMHRIVTDFVAQGGCPTGTGTGGPGYNIDGEFESNGFTNSHSHKPGVISWARSAARNSAGSQFYITLADASFLDGDYAAFGQIIKGQEVLELLNDLATGSGTPQSLVIIESVEINENGATVQNVVKI